MNFKKFEKVDSLVSFCRSALTARRGVKQRELLSIRSASSNE
jgi:hypothetical protein